MNPNDAGLLEQQERAWLDPDYRVPAAGRNHCRDPERGEKLVETDEKEKATGR